MNSNIVRRAKVSWWGWKMLWGRVKKKKLSVCPKQEFNFLSTSWWWFWCFPTLPSSKDKAITIMKIYYQIWTNGICNKVTLDVDPKDHISTIKRAIQDKEGICLDRQHLLTLFCDGKHLENSKTLADYQISENAMLLASIRCDDGTHRIYVKVSWTGKTIPLGK